MTSIKETPLLSSHVALGARLTEFSGWQMPLQYQGVIAEHNAVRNDVGMFDVTHLGKLLVSSDEGGAALQTAVTIDIGELPVGKARYALALTEDAGCIDDVFIYRLAEGSWLVVPNAANVDAVADSIGTDHAVDAWDRWAILAIQGPRSFEAFEKVFPGSGATELPLHTWMPIDINATPGMVARTGYTGERGFELYVDFAAAEWVWQSLIDSGCTPVGLGARDTLRLEMGYALYGHELTRDINPLEAGLGWAIDWGVDFRGRERLQEVKEAGPRRRSFGIVCKDRGIPRQGYLVLDQDVIGEVTSGNHSPTLGRGIALALGSVERIPPVGASVAIDARGRRIAGDIVKPPFVGRG